MKRTAGPSPKQVKPASTRSRLRDWIEIAIAYTLIMAVVWTPQPLQRVLWVVAAAGVIFIIWRSFDSWNATGLRAANFGRSLWIAGVAFVLAGAAVAVAARMHTLHVESGLFDSYLAYAIWAGVQQFLLQGFFLLRLLRVIPKAWAAALATAVLFASAHVPNPILVPITLFWGFAACLHFLRYRNLYPLMIAHAILGITVAVTIPKPAVHNMRVGLGYLNYSPSMHAHRFHRPGL